MNHRLLGRAAAITAAGVLLAGCGSAEGSSSDKPELKITGAYMPVPVSSDMAAGFFTVTNSGGADTLTSVTSNLAEHVTMHSTEDGAMREQKSFAVPADGALRLERGGNHLMFDMLAHKPKEGEKVSLRLHFATSGTITVDMPVKPATYAPKTGH
ncbi:copper chaperone PCu(A)C [Streptomyces sp. NPDC052051]|uniref:copper chaperone PCu(A)C n=1 Tax=Streptomyces sp. NPDC052051 TaxID=3154649 RepID=UPI00341ECFFF